MAIHIHVGKRTKDAPAPDRNAYVKNVLAVLGIKPSFVDPMTHGYRVSLGRLLDASEKAALASKIRSACGVSCTFRERTGYGPKSGKTDIIIPFKNGS